MQPSPVAPPRRGLPTWLLVVLIIGALSTCGVGSCLVLGLAAVAADDAPPGGTAAAPATAPAADGEAKWVCSASGFVQSCPYGGGTCMMRSVYGAGVGADQYSASQMAQTACRGSAIALGGNATCTVTCSKK